MINFSCYLHKVSDDPSTLDVLSLDKCPWCQKARSTMNDQPARASRQGNTPALIPQLNYPNRSWLDKIPTLSDDPTHPAQIALRTYALALSLSLGPSLVPFVVNLLSSRSKTSSKTNAITLKRVLSRELGHDGFAFAVTLSVAGGAAVRKYLWRTLQQGSDNVDPEKEPAEDGTERSALRNVLRIFSRVKRFLLDLSPTQQTFLSFLFSSSIGILLIQAGRQRSTRLQLARRAATTTSLATSTSPLTHPALRAAVDRTSPTLDLTLLLLVRAVDSILQTFILQKPVPPSSPDLKSSVSDKHPEPHIISQKLEKERVKRENEMRQQWTSQVDALVFWACSARYVFLSYGK